jgi:hypothetical protein
MDLSKFSSIRPYVNYSFTKLLRLKCFFFFCGIPQVIKNLNKIYTTSSRIIGQHNMNLLLKNMYCDFLTGGSDLDELDQTARIIHERGLYSSINYSREFLKKEEENVDIL